jgi:hypothetical protein
VSRYRVFSGWISMMKQSGQSWLRRLNKKTKIIKK